MLYHELPNDGLVEVLRAGIDTLRDQIASIDMLLLHAPFPFLDSGDSFLLQATSLTFLLRFPSLLERSHISVGGSANAEEWQIRAARAARPGTLTPMIGRATVVGGGRASMVTTGGRGGMSSLLGLGVPHDDAVARESRGSGDSGRPAPDGQKQATTSEAETSTEEEEEEDGRGGMREKKRCR